MPQAEEAMISRVERRLVEAGVRNLHDFGYPAATADNILSDPIYSQFFSEMLKDNLGKGIDAAILALQAKIRQIEA